MKLFEKVFFLSPHCVLQKKHGLEQVDAHSAEMAGRVYVITTPADDAKLGQILFEGVFTVPLPPQYSHRALYQPSHVGPLPTSVVEEAVAWPEEAEPGQEVPGEVTECRALVAAVEAGGEEVESDSEAEEEDEEDVVLKLNPQEGGSLEDDLEFLMENTMVPWSPGASTIGAWRFFLGGPIFFGLTNP